MTSYTFTLTNLSCASPIELGDSCTIQASGICHDNVGMRSSSVTFREQPTGKLIYEHPSVGVDPCSTGWGVDVGCIYTPTQLGSFTIECTICDNVGSGCTTKSYPVTVGPCNCQAGFGYDVSGQTVTFENWSSPCGASWSWDFDDGATSTQETPTHTYAQPGTYYVTLAIGCTGGGTSSKMHIITVGGNGITCTDPDGIEQTPGYTYCGTDKYYHTCESDGQWSTGGSCGGNGQICTPNSTECRSGVLWQCNTAGTAWENTGEACESFNWPLVILVVGVGAAAALYIATRK